MSNVIFPPMSERKQKCHSASQSRLFLEKTHEFRASLNTILMSVELLADGEAQTEEERQAYLGFIRTATEHMQQLLDESME